MHFVIVRIIHEDIEQARKIQSESASAYFTQLTQDAEAVTFQVLGRTSAAVRVLLRALVRENIIDNLFADIDTLSFDASHQIMLPMDFNEYAKVYYLAQLYSITIIQDYIGIRAYGSHLDTLFAFQKRLVREGLIKL